MRIKCTSNDPETAKGTHVYLGSGTGNNSPRYMLTVGKEYTVYALSKIGQETMYLLLDDANYAPNELVNHRGEPDLSWYDANLFELTDRTIDPNWLNTEGTVFTKEGETASFPEFIKNFKEFYSRLIDGNAEEVKVFLQYVQKYEV